MKCKFDFYFYRWLSYSARFPLPSALCSLLNNPPAVWFQRHAYRVREEQISSRPFASAMSFDCNKDYPDQRGQIASSMRGA